MSVKAVSLFAGIGGLDLGARVAGVDVELATDIDSEALAMIAARDGTRTLAGDLPVLLETGALLDAVARSPDVVFGGPPCTAFSHAGFWIEEKRAGRDPAAGLLNAYVDALRTLEPSVFILENVPGLGFKTHSAFLEHFLARVRRGGYATSMAVLNAADHGVAQRRRRLFVVGCRTGKAVSLAGVGTAPTRSARWALAGLARSDTPEPGERPSGKYEALLTRVPAGENYLVFTTERGHPDGIFNYRSRYWSFLLKAHPDKPVPTIPAQRVTWNGPFHWDSRHFRVPELARLQGFPDTQPFSSALGQARRWIGNAVPPPLGAAVFRHVLKHSGLSWEPPALEVGDPDASFAEASRELSQITSMSDARTEPAEHRGPTNDDERSLSE